MSKLSNCNDQPVSSELEPEGPDSAAGVCYYRKALNLQSIAEELQADSRANRNPDVIKTTSKLLALVAEMRADNPSCWECRGACPMCPERQVETDAAS